MPDPSFNLMSRMTQTAFSKSVWLLKASADENRMGSYACEPEQPLKSLQYSRVVIDNQNDVSIFQSTISLICPPTRLTDRASPMFQCWGRGPSAPLRSACSIIL